MSFLILRAASHELLRPIAIEGASVYSLIAFLPVSIAAIASTAFAHAALRGAACGLFAGACKSANGIPVEPIGLGIGNFKASASDALNLTFPTFT